MPAQSEIALKLCIYGLVEIVTVLWWFGLVCHMNCVAQSNQFKFQLKFSLFLAVWFLRFSKMINTVVLHGFLYFLIGLWWIAAVIFFKILSWNLKSSWNYAVWLKSYYFVMIILVGIYISWVLQSFPYFGQKKKKIHLPC